MFFNAIFLYLVLARYFIEILVFSILFDRTASSTREQGRIGMFHKTIIVTMLHSFMLSTVVCSPLIWKNVVA